MARPVVIGLLSGLAFLVVLGGILFGCAGHWDLPFFWAFLGVWAATMLVAVFVVDPGLIEERMRPGPGGRDYASGYVLSILWLGATDRGRRWTWAGIHWSDTVPLAVQVAGVVAMAVGMAVLVWAEAVNRFFSTVIRIQTERGHHVITSGPYRYLRHPGYAASPLLFVGGGLVLGSWLARIDRTLLDHPDLAPDCRGGSHPPRTARRVRRLRAEGPLPRIPGRLVMTARITARRSDLRTSRAPRSASGSWRRSRGCGRPRHTATGRAAGRPARPGLRSSGHRQSRRPGSRRAGPA